MNAPAKKPRLPRIEQHRPDSSIAMVRSNHSEDAGHLWVISYADLLMVLLCFFVLFFSSDESRRESVIHRILSTTKEALSVTSGADSGSAASSPSEVKTVPKALPASIALEMRDLHMKMIQDGESLIMEFPDNSFAMGKSTLQKEQSDLLGNILSRLQPFYQEIDLVFVGHTDALPVFHQTARVLDNFDLSAERAKGALNTAIMMGFPRDHMKLEADAYTGRQSRTLSIMIQSRGDKP